MNYGQQDPQSHHSASSNSSSIKDKFEIIQKIGEGAYGIVYKCRQKSTGELVAIKKFTEPDSVSSIHKIAIREIRMLKLLRHPNLIHLLEIFKRKHHLHLVFQFVELTLLHELERKPYRLTRTDIKSIIYQIILGIDYCHKINIIHRDIKPENILLTEDFRVKICDFGFARPLASSDYVYTDYVATRWYRSPELLVGDTKYGPAVDIWAIGCVFVEMIIVYPLWPGKSDLDQLFLIVNTLGSLPMIHKDQFNKNSYFNGFHVPEPIQSNMKNLEQIFRSENKSITVDEFHFISKCFEMDPSLRATCSELIQEPLFASRRDSRHTRWLNELVSKNSNGSSSRYNSLMAAGGYGLPVSTNKTLKLPSLLYYPTSQQFPHQEPNNSHNNAYHNTYNKTQYSQSHYQLQPIHKSQHHQNNSQHSFPISNYNLSPVDPAHPYSTNSINLNNNKNNSQQNLPKLPAIYSRFPPK